MIKVIKHFYNLNPANTILVSLLFFLQSVLESVGLSLVVPVFQKLIGNGEKNSITEFIDRAYYLIGLESSIKNIFLGLIIVFTLKSCLLAYSRHIVSKCSSDFLYLSQKRIIEAILKVNLSFLNERRQGELINSITTEAERASTSFIHSAQWISSFLSFLIYVTFTLYISSYLAVGAAIVAVLVLSPLKLLVKIVKKYGQKTTDLNEELQSTLIETFSAMKVIKASSNEKGVFHSIDKIMCELKENWAKTYFHGNSVHIYSEPLVISLLCGIFYVAYSMGIPFVEMIIFLLIFQRILPSFTTMISMNNNVNMCVQGFDKVERIISDANQNVEVFGDCSCPKLEGEIVFDDVHFAYLSNKSVLKGLSLSIPFGKTVAFLGESGAGKTTIIDLLLGFYRYDHGSLMVNGVDLRNITMPEWRKNTAYVGQQPVLFHASVYENIVWGMEEVDKSRVIHACQQAAAHDFITKLPDEYNTIIGDNGVKLSGGQRQRIVLARALLKKPKVLILDEATSALDHESELAIKNSIKKLKEESDITIIMIAHRLTTVKEADIIFVLEDGRLKEQGSWNKLRSDVKSYLSKSSVVLT